MTIDEAIKVLNQHKHGGCASWVYQAETGYAFGVDQYDVFETFEAIAIAEKYAIG